MEYIAEDNIVNLLSSSSTSSKSSTLSQSKSNVQQSNFSTTNQVAIKLNKDGDILQSNINPMCIGKNIIDLCHSEDKDQMKMHIHNVLNPKQSNMISNSIHVPPNYSCLESFRIQLSPQTSFVRVKADSRFFFNQTPGECDYIMCVLTGIDPGPSLNNSTVDNSNSSNINLNSNSTSPPIDSFMPSSIESNLYNTTNSKQQNSRSYLSSSSTTTNSTSNVGGPLMTSVLNESSPRATTSQTFTNQLENAYNVDYDFDIDQVAFDTSSRPNSRTSSSSNMFHPGNIPSNIDDTNHYGLNFNMFQSNFVGGSATGEFSDSRDQINNNSKFSNKNLSDAGNHNSEKLRNLLTTKKSSSEEQQEHQNRILKVILYIFSIKYFF